MNTEILCHLRDEIVQAAPWLSGKYVWHLESMQVWDAAAVVLRFMLFSEKSTSLVVSIHKGRIKWDVPSSYRQGIVYLDRPDAFELLVESVVPVLEDLSQWSGKND